MIKAILVTIGAMAVCVPASADVQIQLLASSGHWRAFRSILAGEDTCFEQINQTGGGRDWMVALGFSVRGGLILMLGDADGSPKNVTRMRVELPDALPGDSPMDTGPSVAHSVTASGGQLVATPINVHPPGYYIDPLAALSMAEKIRIVTNVRTYTVPMDGRSKTFGDLRGMSIRIDRQKISGHPIERGATASSASPSARSLSTIQTPDHSTSMAFMMVSR